MKFNIFREYTIDTVRMLGIEKHYKYALFRSNIYFQKMSSVNLNQKKLKKIHFLFEYKKR